MASDATQPASPDGMARVLEHLAFEVLEHQARRGVMDAHAVAHFLLQAALPAGRNVEAQLRG